jgi:hypothetical protein
VKKYLRARLHELVKLDDPPHKLAFAFALGVFIAFSPWIGLHIISCIFLAWLFRVSKLVVLTASFVNNPWTIVPMYGFCLWFGVRITGSAVDVPSIAWKELGIGDIFGILKPFLWPFIAGTLVLGAVAAVLSYFLFYWAVVRYRKLERQ